MQKQEFFVAGPAGDLQTVLQLPDNPDFDYVAIICHPHPLQDGNMDNKVVTTVTKAFNHMNIPAVRFNYRGVGKSAGSYGNFAGEVADCLAIVSYVKNQWPLTNLYLAGFSFGAYIAAETATNVATNWLISIAPAIERMPYYELPKITCPWLVIQGETDEVVVPQGVYDWFNQLDANKTLVKFPETGHFFHGKLIELQQTIEKYRP